MLYFRSILKEYCGEYLIKMRAIYFCSKKRKSSKFRMIPKDLNQE